MKRLSIVSKPIAVDDLTDFDADYTDTWQLKSERLRIRQMRKFKHQLA